LLPLWIDASGRSWRLRALGPQGPPQATWWAFLINHAGDSPRGIVNCIASAGETPVQNPRGDHSEMWEELKRIYLNHHHNHESEPAFWQQPAQARQTAPDPLRSTGTACQLFLMAQNITMHHRDLSAGNSAKLADWVRARAKRQPTRILRVKYFLFVCQLAEVGRRRVWSND